MAEINTQLQPNTHPLCPGEDDVLLQQIGVVHIFQDDGDARQKLDLMELHHTLETSQQILLGLFVVVAELWEQISRWGRGLIKADCARVLVFSLLGFVTAVLSCHSNVPAGSGVCTS